MKKLGVAVVGCGNIARAYGERLSVFEAAAVAGAVDLDPERAGQFAAKYGGRAFSSLDDLLAERAVDVVVNLTIHGAHYDVTRRCLEAGKHVYSEKPMALSADQARELVRLADARGVRLGCAPSTWMGEAQQTAWKLIRDGFLGRPLVVYADMNSGRNEYWHPNPAPFHAVGPFFDIAGYPLTLITAMLGPVRRITACGKVLFPERKTLSGESFRVEAPDFVVAVVELAGGVLARITVNFSVNPSSKQTGVEFHGDAGSIYLGHVMRSDATLEKCLYKKPYEPVPPLREPFRGIEFARGATEMIEAIVENRPHRATGAHAAHVVETICAGYRSMKEGRPVAVTSDFPASIPLSWAR